MHPKLYHYTTRHYLNAILLNGIRKGDVALSPETGFNAPWLTSGPRFDRQPWSQGSRLDKTEIRLEVRVPAGDQNLRKWRSVATAHGVDDLWYEVTSTGVHDGHLWYLYMGVIPPDWIVDLVERPGIGPETGMMTIPNPDGGTMEVRASEVHLVAPVATSAPGVVTPAVGRIIPAHRPSGLAPTVEFTPRLTGRGSWGLGRTVNRVRDDYGMTRTRPDTVGKAMAWVTEAPGTVDMKEIRVSDKAVVMMVKLANGDGPLSRQILGNLLLRHRQGDWGQIEGDAVPVNEEGLRDRTRVTSIFQLVEVGDRVLLLEEDSVVVITDFLCRPIQTRVVLQSELPKWLRDLA